MDLIRLKGTLAGIPGRVPVYAQLHELAWSELEQDYQVYVKRGGK